MHAIVSVLDDPHYARVESLWSELESECGLSAILLTPIPHLSWQIAAEYDFKRLEDALSELARQTQPFTIRTSGLGLFTGESPVLFVQVVKDQLLTRFHYALWERTARLALTPSSHYTPEAWVPHITLAHGDIRPTRIGCAMQKLAFQPFDWEIRIDHLALVYQLSGQIGKLQSRFPLRES